MRRVALISALVLVLFASLAVGVASASGSAHSTDSTDLALRRTGTRPAITRLSASSAKPGATLVITGARFGSKRGKSAVLFGVFKATSYARWGAGHIICRVPVLPAGRIQVKVRTAKGTSAGKSLTVKAIPTVVSEKTELLTAETVAGATTADGATYSFTETSQTGRLTVGEVIIAEPTVALPEGVFRKVTAISGGGASVSTAPASLEDVLAGGQFGGAHTLTRSDFKSTAVAPGVRLVRSQVQRPDLLTFRLGDATLTQDADLGTDFGPVNVSGTITLKITVHVSGAVTLRGVQSFEASETTTVASDIRAAVTEEIGFSEERTLATWGAGQLAGFTIMAGPVPLYFQPELSIFVGADGEFQAGVEASVHQEASGSIGLSYQAGTFTPWSRFTTDSSYQPPTLFAAGSIKGYAGAQLGLKLYALAGPYIRVDGYAKLAADTRKTPWWTLKTGLEGSLGAQIGIDAGFIHWKKDWRSGDLTFKEWTLAQAETPAPTPEHWAAVAPSGYHTLAIAADGGLWSWGVNDEGCLGTGDTKDRLGPARVGTSSEWRSVAAGGTYSVEYLHGHSLAIKTDGSLWAWGSNRLGELGLGDTAKRTKPTRVGQDASWKAVSAGSWHTVAVRRDGSLWAWGDNEGGQLGLGDTGWSTNRSRPTRVGSDADWTACNAMGWQTLALKSDGSLWAWGANWNGQLGVGDTTDRSTPTRVGLDHDWRTVSSGGSYGVGLKQDGSLWTWGDAGLDAPSRLVPTQVGSARDWVAVASGWPCSVVKQDGTLWTLDLADFSLTRTGSDSDWSTVTAANQQTFAFRQDGSLWGWGWNGYGQLGLGDAIDRLVPTQVGGQ